MMPTRARVEWYKRGEALPEPGATVLLATKDQEVIESFFHFDFSSKTFTSIGGDLVFALDEIFFWGRKPNGPRRENPLLLYRQRYRAERKARNAE
jgi:hypothetical protein